MNLLLEIYNKIVLSESISVDSVTDAIKNKHRIVINYDDDPAHGIAPGIRTVEVYAYGLTKAGNPVIRAYQPYGDTASEIPDWKLFRLDRIKSWKETYSIFNKPAPLFNPNGDRSMSQVFEIANFGEEPQPEKQQYKPIGNIDNIEDILSAREKDKKSKKDQEISASKFRTTANIGPRPSTAQELSKEEPKETAPITEPEINIPEIENPTGPIEPEESPEETIKTKGDEEVERMKDLSRRMNNARKIDLTKIPKR